MPNDAPKMTLDEIEAKRKAIADARAKQIAKEIEDQAYAEYLQELADDEALVPLEAEFGTSYVYGEEEPGKKRLAQIKTPFGRIFIKRAEPIVWARFARQTKPSEKDVADLVHPSLVYPTKARFTEICEQQPITMITCASAIHEMAGTRSSEIRGK